VYGLAAVLCVVFVLLRIWAVPSLLSGSTLGWGALLVLGGLVTLLLVQRWGEPTRSIAGILYDTDQPTKDR
jgi:hypothetical protein